MLRKINHVGKGLFLNWTTMQVEKKILGKSDAADAKRDKLPVASLKQPCSNE